MSKKSSSPFTDLTWDDIQEWAGSKIVSRGRSYQDSGHVRDLAKTETGGIVAWVWGTERYATRVEMEEGRLTSSCTCPYWGTCKHAVAVVLEYLERLKQKADVPLAKADDPRLTRLETGGEDLGDEEDWSWEDEEEEEWEEEEAEATVRVSTASESKTSLRSYLEKHTKAELIDMLEELSERHPVVREALRDRRDLKKGDAAHLVKAVRADIAELSSEPAWYNAWNGEGNIPDYSRVKERLEALLTAGHADEVVSLGEELMKAGTKQVEMSDDEGETVTEIAECMTVAFRALSQSSLSPSEQILWAVNTEFSDQYDLCGDTEVFWKEEWGPEVWTLVADELARRLSEMKPKKGAEDFTYKYRRDRLSNWLIHALYQAERDDEVIPLCEREAALTASYVRLVDALMEAKQWEEAGQWARKGIEATSASLPGIASELRKRLRNLSEQAGDSLRVVAFRADEFFEHPSLSSFQELERAASQAEVWPAVREHAMHYLETGKRPTASESKGSKEKKMPEWPLPDTAIVLTKGARQPEAPMTSVLIEIAISEKKPDEVLRWYDQAEAQAKAQPFGWGWVGYDRNRVAEAVAEAYPDRALEIWKKMAEAQIAQTNVNAYEAAANLLRKVHRVLKKLGREEEWNTYLAQLRETHRRKRRLLEILGGLDGRRIIDG